MTEIDSEENFRDSISTIDESGKRKWIYAKKPSGFFYNRRKITTLFLLLVLCLGPFLKVDGNQFFLFNVIDRKFHFFGFTFWMQDFHLVVIIMLLGILFITLFTVVYGRLFCGWICPQTIFLEMIFRPIEYWIEGDRGAQIQLSKQPWNWEKTRKRVSKWFVYFVFSFAISNIFLAYLVGGDALVHHIQNPSEFYETLIYLLIFTGVFYFIFAWFREQVCIIACPYGRLQSVLLDKNSVVIAYDYLRGERATGRAKFKKNEPRAESGKGDCIDCKQCVLVCPTGIDIRNGTQLECVNCTACIDACDSMMKAVGLPPRLIRYASEAEIAKGKRFNFTLRSKAYTAVLGAFMAVFFILVALRNEIEAIVLRVPGQLYHTTETGKLQNVFTYSLVNKTTTDFDDIEIRLIRPEGKVYIVSKDRIQLSAASHVEGTMFVIVDPRVWKGKKLKLILGLFDGDNLIEKTTTHFLGPQTYQ